MEFEFHVDHPMRLLTLSFVGTAAVLLSFATVAAEPARPALDTGRMGGVDDVYTDDLAAMQKAPYVLRARDGKLTKVPAEKVRLPRDPKGHPQSANVTITADGTLFVRQSSRYFTSTDGGRTWESQPLEQVAEHWQPLDDGSFVGVTMTQGPGETGPAKVLRSTDRGRSWQPLSEIPIDVPRGYLERYSHWGLRRLPDGTLLFGIDLRDSKFAGEPFKSLCVSGSTRLMLYRSQDGGETWQGPSKVCDWSAEGGIAVLPSGKLLAAVRYQRPLLPTDPPDLLQKINGNRHSFPYKHLFLIESDDGGRSWRNLRQLTTVFGQCFGYPAALSDGTVAVVHDTRYGPGPPSGRAMISHNEGKTWEDEAYYLYYGTAVSGYSHSIALDEGVILTVAGTSDHPPAKNSWDAGVGHADLTAIRWRPVK